MHLSESEIADAKAALNKQRINGKLTKADKKAIELFKVGQAYEVLTQRENTILKTKYDDAIESLLMFHLKRVRPKFFQNVFGIQPKQRNDMAERFDLPCGSHNPRIDFLKCVVSMRALIVEHAHVIASDDDSPDMAAAKLSKLLKENDKLEKQIENLTIQNDELNGKLISGDIVDEILGLTAGVFRQASLEIQKKGHIEAFDILDSAITRAARHVQNALDDISQPKTR